MGGADLPDLECGAYRVVYVVFAHTAHHPVNLQICFIHDCFTAVFFDPAVAAAPHGAVGAATATEGFAVPLLPHKMYYYEGNYGYECDTDEKRGKLGCKRFGHANHSYYGNEGIDVTDNEIKRSMISAREEYINIIKSELLGPGSEFSLPDAEHELISSTPTSRYSVGILFPQGNEVNQDNDETVELEEADNSAEITESASAEEPIADPVQQEKQSTYAFDETADENLDEEIGMATQYMPSSMGITFIASGNTNIVRGRLTFATYRNAKITDCMIPYWPDDPDTYTVPPELAHIVAYDKEVHALRLISSVTAKEARSIFERDTIPENELNILKKIIYRFVDYCAMGYVRVPHEIPEFVLDFSHGDYVDDERNRSLDDTDAKLVALRRRVGADLWSVTVMLVNGRKESPVKANRCIFQAKLKVSSENNDFVFAESNPHADTTAMDSEEQSLDLLYRHKKIYGTGLGTSVSWDINASGIGSIWSDFFPTVEIPSMSSLCLRTGLSKAKNCPYSAK